MFENESKKGFLPGYTGYVPQHVPEKYTGPVAAPKKHIPGYQGFVAAVKSENMFGETFGKITQKSGYGEVCKGREVPAEERYKTVAKEHHKHPIEMAGPTVAATVGVERAPEVFEKPIDPAAVHKFWGLDPDADPVIKQNEYEKNMAKFFGVKDESTTTQSEKKRQTRDDVVGIFFAVPEKNPIKLGDPIPGYGGTNRRVFADNLFGMTYGEAKRKAQESQKKVEDYQSELLKKTSSMKPGYKWGQ